MEFSDNYENSDENPDPLLINMNCNNLVNEQKNDDNKLCNFDDNLLLKTTFLDGKMMKAFFMFLVKIHSKIILEFYKGGILGIEIKNNTNVNCNKPEFISEIQISAKNLFMYKVFVEKLENFDETKAETTFFSLEFETDTFLSFLQSAKVDTSFTMTYYKGDKFLHLKNLETQGCCPIPINFSLKKSLFPIEGTITEQNIDSNLNVIATHFSNIAIDLTKNKTQLSFDMYIWIQKNTKNNEGGAFIFSTENKFTKELGNYNQALPPDFSFCIRSEIMKAMGLIHKVNSHGFLEFICLDENLLRVSTKVSNFIKINMYVFPKKIISLDDLIVELLNKKMF